jgi:N6-adenosine-specific RNA methylase IME4
MMDKLLIDTCGHTLAEYEQVIQRGLATFVEVGEALMAIRDNGLYHDKGYKRFEDYCKDVWGWERAHAYRLIDSAHVAGVLSPMGDIPTSERQARELAPLARQDEAAVVEVWHELRETHGDKVTAKIVKEAVEKRIKREEMIERRETIRTEARAAQELAGKYRVIYADPPWRYSNTMPAEFVEQADHYATMSMPELCAMPIRDIAEDNAVLFLWVTSPILHDCFDLIAAWGFQYKASFIWDKVKHVMGHYNSVRHEMLLICVRGSCQPDVHRLFDSVVTEERTAHSRKPHVFREIIDTIYPHGARIELFAREATPGWEAFGNEL